MENRLVIHIPTVKLNHHATIEDRLAWVSRIDQVIDGRLDRKGIVHVTSYARRDFLMDHSRFKHLMLTHNTDNIQSSVQKFKVAPAPMIMVSPAMTEGQDFPEEECRYIIIGKVPFLDTRDPLTAARAAADKEWSNYETMQVVVQSAGRGNRKVEDKCEIIIVDDDWVWFWRHNKHFSPGWFQEAVRFEPMLPTAIRL